MSIEIDQSGKIEQTNLNTIIALSNKVQYALILKKRTKRVLQALFRAEGRPRMFIYQTFAALIALVLKEAKPKSKVTIDTEYFGYQDLLKKQIEKYAQTLIKKEVVIEFGYIGKESNAHILAERVAYKKQKENKIVSLDEIVRIIWPIKNDRESAD